MIGKDLPRDLGHAGPSCPSPPPSPIAQSAVRFPGTIFISYNKHLAILLSFEPPVSGFACTLGLAALDNIYGLQPCAQDKATAKADGLSLSGVLMLCSRKPISA